MVFFLFFEVLIVLLLIYTFDTNSSSFSNIFYFYFLTNYFLSALSTLRSLSASFLIANNVVDIKSLEVLVAAALREQEERRRVLSI